MPFNNRSALKFRTQLVSDCVLHCCQSKLKSRGHNWPTCMLNFKTIFCFAYICLNFCMWSSIYSKNIAALIFFFDLTRKLEKILSFNHDDVKNGDWQGKMNVQIKHMKRWKSSLSWFEYIWSMSVERGRTWHLYKPCKEVWKLTPIYS